VVNINQSGTYTLGSNMTGSLALNHIGTGTTTLTGTNTYTGNTTISAGTLLLAGGGSLGNGAVAVNGGQFTVNGGVGNGGVTVGSGATLGGNGTISGAVSIASGGTLAPGNSPGIINIGSLSLAAGSLLSAEITGSGTVAGTDYDQVNVTGTISLLGNLTLTLTSYTPADGQLIFLINNDLSDTITTGFANVNGGSLSNNTEFNLAGERWFISYEANYNGGTGSTFTGGNDVALYAVPEPGTWALLALTLTTAMLLRRRRAHS
jgi:fibronectin-binding autotransporter adhesin